MKTTQCFFARIKMSAKSLCLQGMVPPITSDVDQYDIFVDLLEKIWHPYPSRVDPVEPNHEQILMELLRHAGPEGLAFTCLSHRIITIWNHPSLSYPCRVIASIYLLHPKLRGWPNNLCQSRHQNLIIRRIHRREASLSDWSISNSRQCGWSPFLLFADDVKLVARLTASSEITKWGLGMVC